MNDALRAAVRRPFRRVVAFRRFAALSALGWTLLAASACQDKDAPEYVADQFVDAYFRRMDQLGARTYTALGATEMLDRELELARGVREQGYLPSEASAQISCRRTARSLRGERVRFDYDIDIRRDESEDRRTADVELAKIQSGWKVVRVEVRGK